MITYVNGILTAIQEDSVVIDVHGIGYEVICPNPYIFQDTLNEVIKVHTYHHVRDDAQLLYGFKDEEEKQLFIKLISVSGIGPKGALAILSRVNIPEFVSAVEREDATYLTSFPGVGKKTARQIILDLKGKLAATFMIVSDDHESTEQQVSPQSLQETEEALKALGYTDKEVRTVMPSLKKLDTTNTDELVRQALRLLMKN